MTTTEEDSSYRTSTSVSCTTDVYSDDNFESLTDADHSIKEVITSEAPEVYPGQVEKIETKNQFLRQKIETLKKKPLGQSHTAIICPPEQSVQLEEFTTKKLAILLDSDKKIPDQYRKTHTSTHKILKNTRKLERLKIDNAIFQVEKKIAQPFHQPKKCKKCRQLQGKINENKYLKQKTAQLRKQQFCDDLGKHLYHKDSVTLIADIINSGPQFTDSPQEIWDRLLKKGKDI